jgi:hypothetical protein
MPLDPNILSSFKGSYDVTQHADSAVYNNKRVTCIAYINLFIIHNTTRFGRGWPSSGLYTYKHVQRQATGWTTEGSEFESR